MAVRIHETQIRTIGNSFVGLMPTPYTSQTAINPTSSSQQSEPFAEGINSVTVEADEDVHVNFGTDPTATTNNPKVAGGTSRDFLVTPGHKLAVRTA